MNLDISRGRVKVSVAFESRHSDQRQAAARKPRTSLCGGVLRPRRNGYPFCGANPERGGEIDVTPIFSVLIRFSGLFRADSSELSHCGVHPQKE